MKIATGNEIIRIFEESYPKHLAASWDNVGLLIGTLDKEVTNVLVTLDVSLEVVDEAIEQGAQLIIAHHSIIFKPLKSIDTSTTYGKIIEKCIKNNITIYSAHTNLDTAENGVSHLLANALNLQNTKILDITHKDTVKKLGVYVPETYAKQVKDAIHQAGAGILGNYSHCSFTVEGEGSFMAENGANPFMGEIGEIGKVKEIRIETLFPASIENSVIEAMIKSHPYEEVAYDIMVVENYGTYYGYGKIGTLEKKMTLEEFAEYVKVKLDTKFVRMVGNNNDVIEKVAVLGGDGNDFIDIVIKAKADVFVTGDIKYHIAQDAQMGGLHIIDPGHNVEKIMKKGVRDYMVDKCNGILDVSFIISNIDTEPFKIV